MGRQKSQQRFGKPSSPEMNDRRAGTLFIVGMPIGTPDDLTLRARTVLGQVSIVAAETPPTTRALLDHHGIAATITGYGGDKEKIAILLDRLNAGHDIALVSDSGMPVIYDPGRLLIAAARAEGHRVTVIPGPSAVTAAAALSGCSADRLLFIGRLPQSRRRLDQLIQTLVGEAGITVMFAPPSNLPCILDRIGRILPRRTVTLAVNMTKTDEQLYQGKASDLLKWAASLPKDSEVTLLLSGAQKVKRTPTAAGS
jgi:16S rRNA (cytidine1402-2'-O)-methyltransferase